MKNNIEAESLFEEFCSAKKLKFLKIEEGSDPTPDYQIILNDTIIYIEVKQIDKDKDFEIINENDISSGKMTVGEHIRKKIDQVRKKKQVKTVAEQGAPVILLIYNNLDKYQMFGTEPHDFISAMYGERTLLFDKNKNEIIDYFYGKNKSFEEKKNTSLSAVGLLSKEGNNISVRIYENAFAKNKLDYSKIPECISVTRAEIERVE
ncbi:MAG: hypothetical protein ABSA04_08020 [Desulfobaccales bacterium]|jgi:hypothetical protein